MSLCGVLLRVFVVLLAATGMSCRVKTQPLRIGSKVFTESVILGETAALLAQHVGVPTEHRRGLGGTPVLWHALTSGAIDLYPEYTGTIAAELLRDEHISANDEAAMRASLARRGIVMSRPLGFNDTYALGMQRVVAERLGIRRISDLRAHPTLVMGFTHEFLERAEGWPGVRTRYNLPHVNVRGLDHDVAYRALTSGSIAITDLYSTDAEIVAYDLVVLEDDARHFPGYHAVWLYRADARTRAPLAIAQIERLEGHISATVMTAANAQAKLQHIPETIAAQSLLERSVSVRVQASVPSLFERIFSRAKEHLTLVMISLLASVIVAVPLGIFAARNKKIGAVLLGGVGLIQTIPSLALLVFMIPLLGIGTLPAVVALFLYSLLPIVRNTTTGLNGIAKGYIESAQALGLPSRSRLWLIELPLALPSIVAGIKTAAVINVGTATLGALIGAGGFGQPIMTGIRLDHIPTILEGAVPAAVLAVMVQGMFAVIERRALPRTG